MGKKKEKKPTSLDFMRYLIESYKRWRHIFTKGCSDPTYTDGVNIDLVRNHIIYWQRQCEEVLQDNFIAYPDEYFYPVPQKLPQDFMAVERVAPILAGQYHLEKDSPVPAKNYGLTFADCFKFNWGEVLC